VAWQQDIGVSFLILHHTDGLGCWLLDVRSGMETSGAMR
jgi:hypothetical protein